MNFNRISRLAFTLIIWPGSTFLLAKQADIVVPLDVPEVVIQTHPDSRVFFACPGAQWLNLPGEPQIPWQVITVLLPPDAALETVSVHLKNAVFERIDGPVNVEPAPPVTTSSGRVSELYWPEDKRIVDGKDADIYEKDALWPHTDIKLVSTGQLRTWKLAQVALPLVKYNPAQKLVKKLTSGQIEVYFDRTAPQIGKKSSSGRIPDSIGEKAAKKIAVNFDQQAPSYLEATGSDEMVSQQL